MENEKPVRKPKTFRDILMPILCSKRRVERRPRLKPNDETDKRSPDSSISFQEMESPSETHSLSEVESEDELTISYLKEEIRSLRSQIKSLKEDQIRNSLVQETHWREEAPSIHSWFQEGTPHSHDSYQRRSAFRDANVKRKDCLEWDEWFMATAFLVAKRSKDPVSQVGAVIVNEDKRIVGAGYNGFPKGCSDDKFPWNKNTVSKYDSKYFYVVHAEVNAVLNKITADVKGCTIYVGLFPCNECAKVIIQSGISRVIYLSDKHAQKDETKAAKRMFDAAGVLYLQFTPKKRRIVIDFDEIDWNQQAQIPPSH